MEKALILSGYGINSEMETKIALERAGMKADIVHINDLIAGKNKMIDYRLLVFPGGFSYGDDTGSGNGYANRLKNNLMEDLREFLDKDSLVWAYATVSDSCKFGDFAAFNNEYKGMLP